VQALSLLQHDGLGGERTAGYGAFTFAEDKPIDLPPPQPGRPGLLLSRYHPRPDELPAALTHREAAYKLTAVEGWLRSPDSIPQRRRRLFLVAEGSLVCPPAHPAGDVPDVRPIYPSSAESIPHPVYRYGIPVAAGWSKT
jgi:CRISPR-associated protein Csm4